jgi:hypothetical protein
MIFTNGIKQSFPNLHARFVTSLFEYFDEERNKMDHLDQVSHDKPLLSVSPCDETYSSFIDKDYISDGIRQQLRDTNILVIPNEGYSDLSEERHFPSGTVELFQYIVDQRDERISIGLCIEEDDYKELALHADWVYLADFVVKDIIAPILVTLLAEYIIHLRGKHVGDTIVKSRIIVVDKRNEHKVEMNYEGPATEYKDIMLSAISEFQTKNHRKKHHKHQKG